MGVAFPFRARRRAAGTAVPWMMPVVVAAVAAVVALALVPAALRHRLPDAPPLGQVWMATPNTVHLIQAGDEGVAQLFFGRTSSYVLGGGWGSATPALAWASGVRFEIAVAQGQIPADVHTVMYDPEAWPETPIWERRHPDEAMQLFAETAHEAGYRVVLTPHPSLVDVAGATCTQRSGESVAAAFLRCRIMVGAARLADVVEIQAQYLESDPAAYRALVVAAADQARAANAEVVVLSGLSTRFAAGPQVLLDAWDSVSDVVDGHYMAVPEGIHPEIAASFLRGLAESDR